MRRFAFNRRHVYDQLVWIEAETASEAAEIARNPNADVDSADMTLVALTARRETALDGDA